MPPFRTPDWSRVRYEGDWTIPTACYYSQFKGMSIGELLPKTARKTKFLLITTSYINLTSYFCFDYVCMRV